MGDWSPGSNAVESAVESLESWQELRAYREQVQSHFQQNFTASSIEAYAARTNHLHDVLMRRSVQLAEAKLRDEGQGEPPVPYCFVLFGSGGRSEQTMYSDQDNGLIYDLAEHAASEVEERRIQHYFERLARHIRAGLEQLGYPPCEGNVICTNPRWRMAMSQWMQTIDTWIEDPIFEHIRYLLIVTDARGLYGEKTLCRQLKEHMFARIRQKPELLQAFVNNTLHHKVLLGPFGNLLREQYGEQAGAIDIKYGFYIPMVNGIRLLAIREGVHVVPTTARLQALQGVSSQLSPKLLEAWATAFRYSLELRYRTPGEDKSEYLTSSGKLQASLLNKAEKQQLKRSLKAARILQQYVRKYGAAPVSNNI